MVSTTECNFNLNRPGCVHFCSDPANKCSDDSIDQYCVGKFLKARKDYPHMDDVENLKLNVAECKCLLMGPSTLLEKKMDQVNYGNNACWSPYCRDGTSPQLDQLSKPSWWTNMERCAVINMCVVNINDSNINQYGNSVFKIENCDDEQLEKFAAEEDHTTSTGEDVVKVPDLNAVEITEEMKLMIAGVLVLVLLLILSSVSKTEKLENNLIRIKNKIKL